MKTRILTTMALGLAITCTTALAQGTGPQGDPIQQRDQDRLQTCSPELDQTRQRDQTRLRLQDCLSEDAKRAIQEMKQARERYQAQL
ncbi:MAG TPA: hypothetical protein P5233_20125, partial [Candidatus Paceibacterota bacterium]|nr:hypothetical protein [Candidatus Paceibacterota bacterium]